MPLEIGDGLQSTREVASSVIAAQAASLDRERVYPADNMQALGGGLAALAEACEAVGAAYASTGMVFLMHEVTAATIAIGGGERAARLLPKLASGEATGTLAFSERGTGAHFYSPELRAERAGGAVTITSATGSRTTRTSGSGSSRPSRSARRSSSASTASVQSSASRSC